GDRARPPVPEGDPDAGGDDDEETALPFATRVDSALVLGDEFATGGLTSNGGKSEAFVALVPLDGRPGRRVGLGAVHGDVDPPMLAARGSRLLVATPDMDAGG